MTPGSKTQHSSAKAAIETSKYLGGDEENTHKVKGLDFALLTKAKMKILKEEREVEEKKKEIEENHQEEAAANSTQLVLSRDGVQIDAPKEFKSRMGKALYNAIFVKQREPTADHFLPGRTTFLYDLDEEANQDLPTTVHRSKEADHGSQLELAVTHPDILARITKIMIYYTQGAKAYKKLKKKQKKEKEEEEKKAKGILPTMNNANLVRTDIIEDDLFGDVDGDYIPSAMASQSGINAYSSYVNKLTPIGKPLEQIQEFRDQSIKAHHKNLEQGHEVGHMDEREKEPSFVSDVYAECYPASFEGDGMRSAIIDEDDDEDLTKMDSRNKLKRWDFDSDEQWADYESKREATPKAAFQFGIKNKDGRKPQKKNEQKLKQQLKQIEGMYEEKTGKKFAADEEDERIQENVDSNSYEAKLMQKRVRALSNSDGVFNFNKKQKTEATALKIQEPRMPEPRTPGKRDLTEPRTPGGSAFSSNLFK
jgi:hypothetical protein